MSTVTSPPGEDLVDTYIRMPQMRAIGITEYPEIGRVADKLKMLNVPTPRPCGSEVCVKLAASAMHIDEIYAAQGTALGRFFGPKKVSEESPFLLGSSVSGTIVALGDDVSGFRIGDEVIAIPAEKGDVASWAEYRCLDQKWIRHKPSELSHVDAAATVMAACVAWGSIGFSDVKSGDHCVVVGASGAIGVMTLQFLKSLGCHVTAVCSGASIAFVKQHGADEIVDYTKDDFGDVAVANGVLYDAVFDCVGGRDVEASAFRCLKKTGVFETVVGPMKYIGEKKLSWPAFLKIMLYIVWRMTITRLNGGPRYTFGEKYPRLVINDALDRVLKYNIRMPVPKIVPFEIEPITQAIRDIQTHRSKGRTVIDFSLRSV